MKTPTLKHGLLSAALLGITLITTPAKAQAPPGPLPGGPPQPAPAGAPTPTPTSAVKPRPSIMGDWRLNRDESDDPRKKMQDSRGSGGGRRGGVHMGGPGMGGPGMGGGPYGGRRGMGGNESDEDRQRMQEIVAASSTLTLAEAKKNVETDIFDDQQRKQALFTDGRKPQKSKDLNYQEVTAHWDGNRLVTDEKSPSGNKISRTYELSYDGTQLYETVRLTRGHSNAQVSIRYVYDQPEARSANANSR